jgi:hypothetical protein
VNNDDADAAATAAATNVRRVQMNAWESSHSIQAWKLSLPPLHSKLGAVIDGNSSLHAHLFPSLITQTSNYLQTYIPSKVLDPLSKLRTFAFLSSFILLHPSLNFAHPSLITSIPHLA